MGQQIVVPVKQQPNITYHTTGITYQNVLESPEGALWKTYMIDSLARDAANTPTTTLRPGLIMALHTDGYLREWGVNFATVTNEALGTSNGSTVEYALANDLIIPGSTTVQADNAGGGTFTTIDDDGIHWRFKIGQFRLKTSEANTDVVRGTYAHMGDVSTNTHIPVGILMDEVDLLQGGTTALDTPGRILIAGLPKNSIIKVDHSVSADYGKFLLRTLFGMISLPVTNHDLLIYG